MSPVVTELRLHPIKACKPVQLEEAFLGPRGMEWNGIGDRRWLIVDGNWQMISQRQRPELAMVATELRDGAVRASAPGAGHVVLAPDAVGGDIRTVTLFGKQAPAHVGPEEVSAWFSTFLRQDAIAVYQKDEDLRLCNPDYADHPGEDRVGFADAFPLLVAGEGSLAALNNRLAAKVPMDRFRPNIVVGGIAADAEYGWRRIRLGDATLSLVKPCDRCVVTTIDQETGERTGKEPLATLSRTHLINQDYARGHIHGAIFGENALAAAPGKVRVGDAVEVLETKAPPAFSGAIMEGVRQ